MLSTIGSWGRRAAAELDPRTNVYGVARALLATGTALTLAFNDSGTLFRPGAGIAEAPLCTSGFGRFGTFCLFSEHLEVARWMAIALLAIVASGWRPRIFGPIHFWIASSFSTSALVIDGGDQVSAVLSLLLLPICLLDDRAWVWSQRPLAKTPPSEGELARRAIALWALLLIRVQVAGIYLHAAAGKWAIAEWADGTALYYWLSHPVYGATETAQRVLEPLLTHGSVALLTWGVIVLELGLAAALWMPARHRGKLLIAGLLLHGGIALFQGLVSFAFAMSAALVLFLRPVDRRFRLALPALAVSLLAACGDAGAPADPDPTPPSWSNFAGSFFSTYCFECHAPGGPRHDLASLEGVRREAETIRCGVAPARLADCGPLPPPLQFPLADDLLTNPKPSDAERARLIRWIDEGLAD